MCLLVAHATRSGVPRVCLNSASGGGPAMGPPLAITAFRAAEHGVHRRTGLLAVSSSAGAVYRFRHSALQKRLANAHLQARPASSEGTSALGGSLTRAQRKACGFP